MCLDIFMTVFQYDISCFSYNCLSWHWDRIWLKTLLLFLIKYLPHYPLFRSPLNILKGKRFKPVRWYIFRNLKSCYSCFKTTCRSKSWKKKILTRVDRDKPRNFEFGLWFMDYGHLLWTKDDSGLPTGPLTITKTFKTFLW